MSNLYAANKVNINQSNMKLKIYIEYYTICFWHYLFCLCVYFKTTELSLKCMQFAVSISCIGAMFSQKGIDTYLHLLL